MDLIRSIIDKVKPDEPQTPSHFHLETETNGYLPFDTATVRIKAFADKQKMHRLGNLSFKWFRLTEGRNYEIDNIEDYYHFCVDDIGSCVIVAVTNMDKPSEVECLTFGPVVFDPQVKIEVESMAVAGFGNFDVLYPYKDSGKRLLDPKVVPDVNEIVIEEVRVSTSAIRFGVKGQSYTIYLNRFDVGQYNGNANVLMLKLYEKEGFLEHFDWFEDNDGYYCIYIKFFNRIYKEAFLVLRKLFLTVRVLPIDKELEKLEFSSTNHKLFKSEGKNSVGDMIVLYDNLKETLKRNVSYTKSVISERDYIMQYSESLEDELKMTLKDLKESFNKAKIGKNFDVSKIDKVENSIMVVEQKLKERSRREDIQPTSHITEAKYKKTKEELEKMQKLNDLLAKELKKIKQSQKDRFSKINNSLNYIKELSAKQDSIQYNTQMQPSMNFTIMDKDRSTVKDQIADRSRANIANTDLVKENEALKSELMELKVKLVTNSQTNIQSISKQADAEFFKECFNELRQRIDDIAKGRFETQNTSSTYLNDSILDSVYKAGLNNKVELLNIENSALNRRINYLFKEVQKLRNEHQEYSTERFSKVSDEEYKQLHQKIEELKNENLNLMKEIRNFENLGDDSINIYKKQNTALKTEIDNLRQTSIERENEFQTQLDQKDKLIDQINTTNNRLVEEITRLQNIVTKNKSILNISKSFTDL